MLNYKPHNNESTWPELISDTESLGIPIPFEKATKNERMASNNLKCLKADFQPETADRAAVSQKADKGD